MSHLRPTSDDSRTPSEIRRVEELFDAFEAALKAGSSPKPQDYLEGVAVQDRAKVLIELEALTQIYRPHNSDSSTPPARGAPQIPINQEEDETNLYIPLKQEANEATPLPEQIGKYKILGRLGEGAMGIVYRAHHPVLNRDVALKTIRPQSLLSLDDSKRRLAKQILTERMLVEARNVARLKHPNVVAIHDADEEDGWPYFTMALVEGGTLHSRISEFQFGTPLKNESGKAIGLTTLGWTGKQLKARREKVLTFMEKVCRGVHAAHANVPVIIHRDLKPGNILLEGDEPRVSDFGLARTVVTDVERQTPGEGGSGTPHYMSPEQYLGDAKNILATSDVWAIGVILYELFAGCRPFLGTQQEVRLAVLHREPQRLRALNGGIDLDLEAIVLKCLGKDPSRRYQSASEIADDLARCRAGLPIPSRPISRPERLWRWARRKPALAGLTGLATMTMVAAIILLIAFSIIESRRAREEQIKSATDAYIKGIALSEQADAAQGILWMARSFEMAPADASDLRGLIKESITRAYSKISPLKAIFDDRSPVKVVVFSPDGRTFLTGHEDGIVRLRDTGTGEIVWGPIPHPKQVLAAAFGPDGKTVLTGCFDGYARLWSLSSTASVPKQLLLHTDVVFAVGYSPKGNILFSGGGDGTVRMWDTLSGEPVGKLPRIDNQALVLSLAVSPNGKTIVAGTGDFYGSFGRVRLWDVATKALLGEPLPHSGPVWAVAISPDEKTILTGSEKEALLWDLGRPEEPRFRPVNHGIAVRSVAFSHDGKAILTGGNDKTARLWDATRGRLFAPLHHSGTVRSVAFCPDPNNVLILTGSEDGSVRLWKLPAPMEAPTEHVVLWTQILTGMELDEAGGVRSLNAGEWHQRRQRLDELTGMPTR